MNGEDPVITYDEGGSDDGSGDFVGADLTRQDAIVETPTMSSQDPDWMKKYASIAEIDGGRRRSRKNRGFKKSKTRKGNKMLSSWVAFVKKVQHEEKISYSDAMKRASARKKEWKRGQMGGEGDDMSMMNNSMGMTKAMNKSKSKSQSQYGGNEYGAQKSAMANANMMSAGRRRRGSKRCGSRTRGSRRSRR